VRIIKGAFWVAGMVLLASVLILFVHVSSNNLEFSQYNSGWNGTSRFFSDLDRHRVEHISDPAQITFYHRNATLLIIAPYHPPPGREISAYRLFLEQGNTVVIADDFGTANEILRGIGSSIFILPGNLSSIDRKYPDPNSVVVYPLSNETPLENVVSVVLNRPAALEGGTPLMRSSALSWIDLNGDGRINNYEMLGAFDVMASESVMGGRVVVLSDPSVFINSMADQGDEGDNRQMIQNLVNRDGPLLVDEMNSRTRDAEGMGEILHVIKTTLIIKIIIAGVLVLILAWLWKRKIPG
jgi:hypothetical protein